MKKIAFIIPYFGKWPIWFPAFLKSCESNPTINWIFFTDCEIPLIYPQNVVFHNFTIQQIQDIASEKIGTEINIKYPIKFCDIKPSYGQVFEEYLNQYDYWGFCDIDIIWGDIRKFITDEMLDNYDLISSRKNTISGHFTIFRNTDYNRMLYRSGGIYKELFRETKYRWFDENTFATIVSEKKRKRELKVWWEEYLVNHEPDKTYTDSHQEYYLDRWFYDKGKLYDLGFNGNQKKEFMYLHFINWKKTMKFCELNSSDNLKTFYISFDGIHVKKHSKRIKAINGFKNYFLGYYISEKKRLNKFKLNKLIFRMKNRIKSIL